MPETKICIDCKKEKPLTDFHKSSTEKYGVRSRCKECRSKFNKSNGNNRRWNLLKNYQITPEDFEKMLNKQGMICAICGSADPKQNYGKFNIDHNHKTGKIRGLLCNRCNIGLGCFEEDVKILKKAINYLENGGSYAY